MTEAEVLTLMAQGAAVLIALFGTIGTIVIALINGRINRLKDAVVKQHDEWMDWTDNLIEEVKKLVGGQDVLNRLPPRPRLHLRGRGEEDE